MKRIIKNRKSHLKSFVIILLFVLLSACNGVTPQSPVINSFSVDSTTIDEGDSATLSWSVSDADTVTINQGIGSVALSGTTSVTPVSTTIYTLTATNSAGTSTATVTIIMNQSHTIQPNPIEGKDSMVVSQLPDTNYADNQYFSLGNLSASVFLRGHLQFDVSSIPTDAVIVHADLKLYQYQTIGTEGFIIGLHQVNESWEESVITWNNQPDYLPSPESIVTITVGATTWLSWDITALLQGWVDGSISNYGILLKDTDEPLGDTFIRCYTSDYTTNPTQCPKLEITYYVP
ncbi:MAG: DNRLRE domain-containing protein [Candidatus Delongbacteria bacterium]|nr:DNRLRE domain-containing protein [Candidatus Delongbacteria bacterium]